MRHEIDGFLVLPGDEPRLNAALNRLMGDAALRAQLAALAVEAPERFSMERIARLWEELCPNMSASVQNREQSGFHRTDVLRHFRFPMKVHGHVSEGVVWSAIATRFKRRFVNDRLRNVHLDPNSIGCRSFLTTIDQ